MRLKRILAGAFLAGLLFIGVGGSVAFAEFSSFSYGGERDLSANLIETSFDINIEEAVTTVNIIPQDVEKEHIFIENDYNMNPNTISFKISYPTLISSPVGYTKASADETVLTYAVGCNNGWYVNDPVSFIQGMEEILTSLKAKKIFSYNTSAEISIKANPQTAKLINIYVR